MRGCSFAFVRPPLDVNDHRSRLPTLPLPCGAPLAPPNAGSADRHPRAAGPGAVSCRSDGRGADPVADNPGPVQGAGAGPPKNGGPRPSRAGEEGDARKKTAAIAKCVLERSGQFRAVDADGAALDETTRPDLALWRKKN